jgi:hypothetical protein
MNADANIKTPVSYPGAGPYLWISVPAVSIGGVILGQLLSMSLVGELACIIGSILLFYLAFVKPRRDIVALITPLYALFIFIFPSEFDTGIILQILYSVSISILAVRVELRFSKPREQLRVYDEADDE